MVNDQRGADWIFHSASTWQGLYDATTRRRRGPVQAIGPEREYITEEQVKHTRYQQPLSAHLLKKYKYQY
jgi:hypothetical protein